MSETAWPQRRPRPHRAALFGRADELARIREHLSLGERLVTLTGAGGIGKSRLANEVALRWAGPVYVVDLAAARSGTEALAIIAQALEATVPSVPGSVDEVAAELGRVLAARGPLLLVLDDLDHVVRAVARVIDQWLDLAPSLQVLATTRERLELEGERVIVTAPLGPEGVALFRDRAERAGARVDYDSTEEHALASLVTRLDGLPLAIELAAARADLLSPTRLLALIEKRFDLLGATAEGALRTRHHASMRQAVGLSWELLTPELRQALAALSTLANPFDLTLAAATTGLDEVGIIAIVAALTRRSLMTARGERELCILETVRDFALGEAGGTLEDVLRRRDAYLVARAEALVERSRREGGADALRELGRLGVQLAVVARDSLTRGREAAEAGLRAGLALVTYLRRVGLPVGEPTLLPALANAAEQVDPAARIKALVLSARLAMDGGRPELAATTLADARRILEHDEARAGRRDLGALAEVLLHEGRLAFVRGDFEEAFDRYEAARTAAREAGAGETFGLALVNLAMTRVRLGRTEHASSELDEAHRAFMAEGLHDLIPFQMGMTFFVANHLGDRGRARAALAEGLRVAAELGNARDEAGLRAHMGLVELDHGALGAARDHLERAAEQAGNVNTLLAGQCATQLGLIAVERGDGEDARRWHAEVRRRLGHLGRPADLARADALEAARLALVGDVPAAVACMTRMTGEAQTTMREPTLPIAADGLLAIVHLALGLGGDRAERARHLAQAEARRQAMQLARLRDEDVRRALSLVERAFAASEGSAEVMCVSLDRGAFRLGATWEDLSNRPTLQRLFAALVDHRVDNPGLALDADALGEVGWPGEKILSEARANRLAVTLSKLRKSGLEEVLLRAGGGWLLRAETPILFVEPSLWSPHGDAR